MANRLKITSVYDIDGWTVTAEVLDTSDVDFPRDIFLWTLDNLGALDAFQAIGHVDQVAKYPLYDSDRTSNFGVHLVRYSSSTKRLSTVQERDDHITVLKSAFRFLLTGFETASEPIEEVYP